MRAYGERQWAELDPVVEPVALAVRPGGAVAVTVRQVVRDRTGALLADGQVVHVHVLRDGLVVRMDVEEPRGEEEV